MKIYVVGSCRVHGPLRGRPGYQRPIVGYTHTAKEAIQRIRFVRGEVSIPNAVAPFVFARQQTPVVTAAHRKSLDSADVVVVEVCSAKDVFLDGYSLNLNYAKGDGEIAEVDDLDLDLAQLKDIVSRLAVVQHVELPDIPDRSRFAARVRDTCQWLGVPVFNPTEHVTPDDMLDVNHYKPAVVKRIGDRLMEFLQ